MRSGPFRRPRSAAVILLAVNAAVFVLQQIFERYEVFPVRDYFALHPLGLPPGDVPATFIRIVIANAHVVWQLFTFQFLHAGLMHLLLNSLVIYVFGRALEEALGQLRFLKLYFLSGVIGGALQVLFGWILPFHYGPNGPPGVLGASAGAFGLVAAYASMYPEQPLTMLVAFIIPVTMRAKYLLFFSGSLALFGMIVPFDNVAHAAHLGGMLAGLGYVVWAVKPAHGMFPRPSEPAVEIPRELVNASPSKRSLWQRGKKQDIEDLPPAEFISREVDPILDKISAYGIQSLTARERRILEAARHKMEKS